MSTEKKEKKPIFSQEVDSAINGYAIGISFIGIGIFLLLEPNYFSLSVASYILGAIIGIVGVIGTGIELGKSSGMKGLDNMMLGFIVFLVWLFLYLRFSNPWVNIISFTLLIIGSYAILLGLFQGVYSIIRNIQLHKEKNEQDISKGKILSQLVLFLTQICGLLVAVVNAIKAVSV